MEQFIIGIPNTKENLPANAIRLDNMQDAVSICYDAVDMEAATKRFRQLYVSYFYPDNRPKYL